MSKIIKFLEINKDKCYSVKTIARNINMKTKDVMYQLSNQLNDKVRKVQSLEVGSNKKSVKVFTLKKEMD